MVESLALQDLVGRAGALRLYPEVALAVQRVCIHGRGTPREIERLVRADPSLVTSVFRLASSSSYRPREGIRDLRHAVSVLGHQVLRDLVMNLAMTESSEGGEHVRGRLWLRSLRMGMIAEVMARQVADDPSPHGFVAGLVADIGILVLLEVGPKSYERLLFGTGSSMRGLCQAEEQVFSFDHLRLGAACARSWGFPPSVVTAIRYRYQVPEFSVLTAIVAAAARAETSIHLGEELGEIGEELKARYGRTLGCSSRRFSRVVAEGLQRAAGLQRFVDERSGPVSARRSLPGRDPRA